MGSGGKLVGIKRVSKYREKVKGHTRLLPGIIVVILRKTKIMKGGEIPIGGVSRVQTLHSLTQARKDGFCGGGRKGKNEKDIKRRKALKNTPKTQIRDRKRR